MGITDNTFVPDVDESTMAVRELPSCKKCGAAVRPNILMFGDYDWDSTRTDSQGNRYRDFIEQAKKGKMAMVEMGAGQAIPTIRNMN